MITPAQSLKRKAAAEAFAKAHNIAIPKRFKVSVPFTGRYARELYSNIEKAEWPNLPPNGECDAKMLHLLFPPKPQSIGVRALAVAKHEIGTHEDPAGSNSGPRVSQYEAVCGLNHQPWCACFVTWCLREIGWTEKGWNQAYVPSWVATAHAGLHGLLVISASMVQAGDLAAYDWNHDGIADHIEFAEGPVAGTQFHALGGNTGPTDFSNGGEVAESVRNVSDVQAFIRIVPTRI